MAYRHASVPEYRTASRKAGLRRTKAPGSPKSLVLFDIGYIVAQGIRRYMVTHRMK